jgi:hypothetical protein
MCFVRSVLARCDPARRSRALNDDQSLRFILFHPMAQARRTNAPARSMACHSWEHRRLNWDLPEPDDLNLGECSDEDDEVDREITKGQEFVRFALSLYLQSALSASTFCVLMHHAAAAGIAEAKQYGLKPGADSGNYTKKLHRTMGWKHDRASTFYEVDVPGHGKHDLERTSHVVPVMPCHEQIANDPKSSEGNQQLRDLRAKDGGLPPSYWNPPVVQGASEGTIVDPVAIYIDGVPYSHTDGVIGFWIHFLITGKRYLIAVLRKRIICNCGCRGWCTLWHFMELMKWDLRCLARGRRSTGRHDGKPWKFSDRTREAQSDAIIECDKICACLYIKGDWMEYATTMGFPTWMDNFRPCFDCNADKANMYQATGVTMAQLEWIINEDDDYFDACDRCEIIIPILIPRDLKSIEQFLRYDKRDRGSCGRALTQDLVVNTVQLLANDRLEPSDTLPDVGDLHLIQTFPANITFWRRSNQTLTNHRNPLFDRELGVTPRRSLTVDLLHAVFLGILNVWGRIAIWKLLMCGCYGAHGTQTETLRAGVLVLRSLLMTWYPEHQSEHNDDLTRVADLTVKMVGKQDDPKLKTKGAETWGISLFLIEQLRHFSHMLGSDGDRILIAGEMLEQIVRSWKAHDWTIPPAQIQENDRLLIMKCESTPRARSRNLNTQLTLGS